MESEEPKVVLYDFLYRDSSRITSYYAQIFSGHLKALEEIDTERDSKDRGAKVNAHVVAGDLKSTEESVTSQKRVIDPHDITAIDVLSFFNETKRTQADAESAEHGG